MDKLRKQLVSGSQEIRDKLLKLVSKKLIKLNITPNYITTLSLLAGLSASYFLFENNIMFITLILLHLYADALDGVIARTINNQTKFGKHYDFITDRIISLAILIKISLFLQDHFVYLITVLFIITQIIYYTSDYGSPVIFQRTFLTISTIISLINLNYLVPVTFFISGILTVYSLMLQINWFIIKFVKIIKNK